LDTSFIAYTRGINPQNNISARYGEIISKGAARYFVLSGIEIILYDLSDQDNENISSPHSRPGFRLVF
jgi:hypothetical protein